HVGPKRTPHRLAGQFQAGIRQWRHVARQQNLFRLFGIRHKGRKKYMGAPWLPSMCLAFLALATEGARLVSNSRTHATRTGEPSVVQQTASHDTQSEPS